MDNKEFFNFLEKNQNKYILVHFSAFITHEPNGMVIKPSDDDFWFYQIYGKHIDDHELRTALGDTEWLELIGQQDEGLYDFQMLLSIESDGDEYQQWHYYVPEHVEIEYICSLDKALKDLDDFNTNILSDFEFPF